MNADLSPARRRLTALAVAFAALIAAPLAASPAYASPPPPVAKYVALGDSYAAGQGAGSYADSCLRSTDGYAGQLDEVARINLLRQPACSGATIAEVKGSQISQVNRGTTLVTITAGANDLDIGGAYATCMTYGLTSVECGTAIAEAQQRIEGVGPSMVGLIQAVQHRSPNATIVVTGYPAPFESWLATQDPMADAVNLSTAALNDQLAGAAQYAGAVWVPVSFADHAIGSAPDATWLGGDMADAVSFMHPNAAGYTAYRDAILTALGR